MPSRLALDPDGGDVLLCERIDATELDPFLLERRLLAFAKHAAFWSSPKAAELVLAAASETIAPVAAEAAETMIRL